MPSIPMEVLVATFVVVLVLVGTRRFPRVPL
jgi:hypothetical protein